MENRARPALCARRIAARVVGDVEAILVEREIELAVLGRERRIAGQEIELIRVLVIAEYGIALDKIVGRFDRQHGDFSACLGQGTYDQQIAGRNRIPLLGLSVRVDQCQLIGKGLPGRVRDRIGPGDGLGQILHQELVLGVQAGIRDPRRRSGP